MKTLSSALAQTLNAQNIKYAKKVLLYIRSWNAEQNKYIFNSPVDISAYILDISDIKWKLDKEDYSVWNNANTTITLSNKDNLFTQGNSVGFLPASALLYGAKAEVFGGAKNAAGQLEYVKIFRGFALSGSSVLYGDRTITLTFSGELARLDLYSATDISLAAQGELLGSGSGDTFTTRQNAVGEIIKVYRGSLENGLSAATEIKAEEDYQISSLNQYSAAAQIKLTAALSEGEALWADYRYWYTDKPMEWIAEQIAQQSESDSYQISSVYYDETVSSSLRQPSASAFENGTLQYTEISNDNVTLPAQFLNQIDADWVVGENPSNLTLTLAQDGITLDSGTIPSRITVSRTQNNAYGTWQASASCNWTDQENQWNHFVASSDNLSLSNGYCFTQDRYSYDLIFTLYKIVAGQAVVLKAVTIRYSYLTTAIDYRISRDEQGNFKLWTRTTAPSVSDWHYFGILATDNTYTSSTHQIMEFRNKGSGYVSSIKESPLAAISAGDVGPQGSYLSPVMDGTQNLLSWGNFTAVQEVNSGSAAFYYRAKERLQDDWGDWQELANGGAPDTMQRYLQLRWQAFSDVEQTSAPVLYSWLITWQSRGVNIAMLNTSSMTFLDVMGELARLSGYQIGYDSEGKFIFAPRPSGTALYTVGKSDIIEIESISDGIDKLYNRVTVNFGSFKRTVDPIQLGDARPNLIDKYGVKELSISSGSLLPPDNANLARAAAPGIYASVAGLKKRAVIITKFLPQFELGDILHISYDDVLNADMSVEGIEFNLTDWQIRLDLTEL